MFVSGYGGLSLSIEGPSKADIECHDNEDGSCRVTYKPTEPGNYIINVKFCWWTRTWWVKLAIECEQNSYEQKTTEKMRIFVTSEYVEKVILTVEQ